MTAPIQKTWQTGEVISSADNNSYIRDALNNTAPYVGAQIGDMFYFESERRIGTISPPPAEGRYVLEHAGGNRVAEWREFNGLTVVPLAVDLQITSTNTNLINGHHPLDYGWLFGVWKAISGTTRRSISMSRLIYTGLIRESSLLPNGDVDWKKVIATAELYTTPSQTSGVATPIHQSDGAIFNRHFHTFSFWNNNGEIGWAYRGTINTDVRVSIYGAR